METETTQDMMERREYTSFMAAIGFFDGVHKGHQFLIDQLREAAHQRGKGAMIVTFAKHPRKVLQPNFSPQLLTTEEEKMERLDLAGVDDCLMLDFTPQLAQLTAKDFMLLLKQNCRVDGLLIGYDHRFGHDRTEDFQDYVRHGAELDMEVLRAQPYYDEKKKVVSSSLIRLLLHEGKLAQANAGLGYAYTLSGEVVQGHQVGREIGFPTANLKVRSEKLIPADGVYAVYAWVRGERRDGMLSIGNRPTINNGIDRSIEVHLFDFDEDIYGETVKLELLKRTREEIKFSSREALVNQLRQDKKQIVKFLKKNKQ